MSHDNAPTVSAAATGRLRPIAEVAREAGFLPEEVELHGHYTAKIDLSALRRLESAPDGRIIYVTAITATPAGEGKTTTAIGLTQALGRLGKRVAVCLREPSMGPVFGIKGGATGGGRSQIVPMEEINMHFTGDIHAVGAAHNLLAALIDNHMYQGNELDIDPKRVLWPRVMDMNDRQLRQVIVGLGGRADGVMRETRFDITAASEVMAILCLARDITDLKERLGRILVGHTRSGEPVYARDLGAQGAMAAVLAQAIKPNLVQTMEGQPAFVHGGPFANIAHGNNSIIATRLALKVADYVITEGGFAADLGAEKFFDIVHGYSGLTPHAAVLVVSVRALRMHGGVPRSRYAEPNLEAVQRGLANLDHHIRILRHFGLPTTVAINVFDDDSPEEIAAVRSHCEAAGVWVAPARIVQEGGAGGEELARTVLEMMDKETPSFKPAYDWNLPLREKIEILARDVYGADGVDFTPEAEADLRRCQELGCETLPVCMAKTQHSTTDDPKLKGAPRGWRLKVRALRPSLGAGFVVCLAGDIMTMPGLPKRPAALDIDVDEDGTIRGLF